MIHCCHNTVMRGGWLLFAAMAMLLSANNKNSFVAGYVSYGNRTFLCESMPASFGMDWSPPSQVHQAHLRFTPEKAKLCDPLEAADLKSLSMSTVKDGLPIALLVERGDCSFELKATNVMAAYPDVKFMIVYDDQVSNNLVSMRETNTGEGIDLGLLFVSHKSGMALRAILENQTENVLSNGGPILELDGIEPLILREPSLADVQTWVLIAMGGFFTFITVFGCLLVFVQLGVIPVNGQGQIILTPEAIRRSRRLMTIEEVARLQPGGDLYGKPANTLDDVENQQTATDAPPPSSEKDDDNTASGEQAAEVQQAQNVISEIISAPIPEADHQDDDEEHSCAVCLDDLRNPVAGEEEDDSSADPSLCLPCNHQFHSSCIIPWLTERQGTCPLCKFDVLQYIIDADETSSEEKSSSRLGSSVSWCNQQARRLMRFGWSPIRSNDSDNSTATRSRHAEASTSTYDIDNNNSNDDNNNNNNADTGEEGATPI